MMNQRVLLNLCSTLDTTGFCVNDFFGLFFRYMSIYCIKKIIYFVCTLSIYFLNKWWIRSLPVSPWTLIMIGVNLNELFDLFFRFITIYCIETLFSLIVAPQFLLTMNDESEGLEASPRTLYMIGVFINELLDSFFLFMIM